MAETVEIRLYRRRHARGAQLRAYWAALSNVLQICADELQCHDGFFGAGMFKKFDGILSMYHDQGLSPFKALSFDTGVNFTAGLPFLRTSPVHGTAFAIAGKGEASENSFRHSIYLACDIFRNRQMYAEISKNPLK
ncbi:MAG: 4-hydroxythreonine-4-phosphate dehydrogenase PdxA, partial [Bacteroidia bacterium]|nr:4-hydroxythreonine-4-phosphate dehydrogenase PdxA [Bacteroidia bacterium]